MVRKSAEQLQGLFFLASDVGLVKQAEAALKQLEVQFREAIETSTDGFWITDPQGRLLEVNAAYCKLSGFARDELLSMCIQDLEAVEAADQTAQHIEEVRTRGAAHFESAHRAKDGHIWPVEIVTTYSKLRGGRFFAFIKDRTEHQQSAALIWHQANFDRLTDLPNRSLLFDRLSKECSAARRNNKHVALLFADLDGFKAVNDLHGHKAGDQVLHFETEEQLMQQHAYLGTPDHRKEHAQLLNQLHSLASQVDRGTDLLLQTLKNWLVDHILGFDKDLGAFLQARGVH